MSDAPERVVEALPFVRMLERLKKGIRIDFYDGEIRVTGAEGKGSYTLLRMSYDFPSGTDGKEEAEAFASELGDAINVVIQKRKDVLTNKIEKILYGKANENPTGNALVNF